MRNLLTENQLEEKIDSLIIEYSENIGKNIDLLKNYEIRGGLRTKIGDYQGAEEDISKAIELNPEDELAKEMVKKIEKRYIESTLKKKFGIYIEYPKEITVEFFIEIYGVCLF